MPKSLIHENCRVCYARYELGGDGYDGLCPSCADKANLLCEELNLTWDAAIEQVTKQHVSTR